MKKIFNSLYGKISLIFLLLLIILGVVQIMFSLHYSSNFYKESDQKLNRNLAKDLAQKFKPFLKDSLDYAGIAHSFHEMMVLNPRVEFYLLGEDGSLLAYFAEPEKIKRMQVSMEPVHRFLSEKNDLPMPLYGDDPRSIDRQKPFSVTPIKIGKSTSGYLYVILGGEQYDSAISLFEDSYIIRTSAIAILINIIITALIGLLLFFILTKRLRSVITTVNKFKKGKFSERIKSQSQDEIGQLAGTFNQMADSINAYVETIKNNDLMRRDLIANISHDLRSPLASIQGYLETILIKEESLSADQRRDYLQTVHKNIGRLNKLVYELFELSKLDAKQIKPNWESFSIAELIQDVVLKFHPQAEKNKISIRTNYPQKLPLIKGDIAMIERALANLIDNALNYTPENGEITIEIENQSDRVMIKVNDTGAGIPQDDLQFVFDRFYRVDKSRSSESTGLGLAITKKIIEVHGSEIHVQSELRKGTTFSFILPVATS